ncbi:MMPL family transporter [Modestobacter versicolor]|uniref:MMPL family transporter n=1 Tax=Modestobacter versicolor TaxID=429133 RepID=A0A323VSI6_9ACTN|nr:MMPL family transporter [Modestobacter versicolor]MBB3674308.1 RND superfamily putative drug exporter [Modestobacter versicolor]PZA22018.1 MMPL family transporter [Modestobacter versicolor]
MDPTSAPLPPGHRSRLTRALHSHPRRALLAVLLFVVVAGVLGGPVAGSLDADGGFAPADSDSALAVERLEDASGRSPSAGVVAVVDTGDGRSDVTDVVETLAGLDGVAEAVPAGTARDGSSALVVAVLDADADDEAVATAAVAAFEDDDRVALGGSAVTGLQIGERVGEDLGRAELLAFPVLVLLSLLFFGGRAAVLPLVVGVTTVLGTFLAMAGINEVYGLSVFSLNLVIGLGLGLAIDYTLFLLSRYREELDQQGPTLGAVLTTMRTAGRTVVFSAATVAVALATLTVFPMGFLKSMGIAGAVVAVVAAAAALVVSPAVFALWGPKLARRRRRAAASGGGWYRLSHAVMARPGAVAAVTAIVMLVLAAPALRAEWTPVDSSVVPTDLSARVVADTLEADYAGAGTTPVLAAVRADDPDAARSFADAASQLPGVLTPADAIEVGPGTWQVDLVVDGGPEGDVAQQVVTEVRDLAADRDADVLVGGAAAEFVDQQAAIGDALPLAAALLVLLTVLVLWLMTGSVVLPVKAVVMNTLTAGVALGALTFVYQDGRLTGLLGYTSNGGVEPTNFLVAAAVVFALSTDYGVFLLGRIKEAREAGLAEREAVATGLGRTGSVVTAAAILLAVAIGAFSTSSISFIQQIGIATAVGVLVDAFVVRSFLVPALMGLLGKWNWWAPMPLRRLHDRIGFSEGGPAEPADAADGPPRVLASTP